MRKKFSFLCLHWKNSIAKRTIFWSSEPENIAIRPMLRYGFQNYKSIDETAIQVRWYDNTMYSDRKQNIMPSLSLLCIFACDKTIRDTQKWSFKERKIICDNVRISGHLKIAASLQPSPSVRFFALV